MTTVSMANAKDIDGDYRGKGTWYESTGDSGHYDVDQTNRITEDGIAIRQKHDHEDGTSGEFNFVLKRVAPHIYNLRVNDAELGQGFIMDDMLRFYMKNIKQNSINEIGYQLIAPGRLRVFGSCTGNTAGNYIMWHEELERV